MDRFIVAKSDDDTKKPFIIASQEYWNTLDPRDQGAKAEGAIKDGYTLYYMNEETCENHLITVGSFADMVDEFERYKNEVIKEAMAKGGKPRYKAIRKLSKSKYNGTSNRSSAVSGGVW